MARFVILKHFLKAFFSMHSILSGMRTINGFSKKALMRLVGVVLGLVIVYVVVYMFFSNYYVVMFINMSIIYR